MPPKRNRPLRDQQGLAMILVLCLGALFVALAAALVYAASLMMANADRQLPEQDVYELAVSFSDVLEQELLHYTGAKEKDGAMTEENDQSIGYFINHIYVKKGSIDNPYGDDTDHTFTLQAPEGIDEMTVALEAAQSVCALPVLCSMTVQADGSGYFGGVVPFQYGFHLFIVVGFGHRLRAVGGDHGGYRFLVVVYTHVLRPCRKDKGAG